jgi:multisubunit Na+/H+ antiporter MnhC subunit
MADLWARARAAVGLGGDAVDEEEAGLLASLNEATTLSRTQVRRKKEGGVACRDWIEGRAARRGGGVKPPRVSRPDHHPSHSQRLIAAGTSLAIAALFGGLASLFVVVAPRKFAALYTLSNVAGLAATCFLVGPAKQLRKMADPSRAVATAAYLGSLAGTLTCALVLRSLVLTLACFAVQLVALLWYALSYVPGARGVAWGAVQRCFGGEA